MSTGNPIRIGLIGCGSYGRKAQLANLVDLPGVRVTALYNRSKPSLDAAVSDARAAGHEPATFKTWEALVNDANVDAVVVALPPEFNWPIVKAADAAGKAVLIDKPVAASMDDLHAIEKLARRGRIHIQVGTQLVWSDFFAKLEQETRALGEVLAVRSQVYHGGGWALEPMTWKVDSRSSGGILNSWGAHPLSMTLKLAGGTAIGERPANPGWEADYDELSAFTGVAFEREGVDPAMYDTVTCSWLTLGPGDSDAAIPCHLLYAEHPGLDGPNRAWRIDVLCNQGHIEGDIHARTIKVSRRDSQPRTITLDPVKGKGFDGNRKALEFFADCVARKRIDLGSLHLGITVCRLALEVNAAGAGNNEVEGESPEPETPPRPDKHRLKPRNPNDMPRGQHNPRQRPGRGGRR